MDPLSSSHSPNSDHAWPITLRKRIQSTRNPYHVYNFLSYHHFSPSYSLVVFFLSTIIFPNNVHEALGHLGWRQTMIDEMHTLE